MQILALHLQYYVNRGSNIPMENIKEEARKLIDKLPENSTWDDLIYQIYVRQTIEAGLADSKAGKVTSVQEVRRKFGLPE
jgi:hypothetical protein